MSALHVHSFVYLSIVFPFVSNLQLTFVGRYLISIKILFVLVCYIYYWADGLLNFLI